MGYNTSYSLSIVNGDDDLISSLRDECDGAQYALDDYGDCIESCKWYDHESDLIEFSKKHPESIFKLSGEGEESGDIWIKYFKNGKRQTCRAVISFDDFDERKLI